MTILQLIDQCDGDEGKAIQRLGTLSNRDFVDFIRQTRREQKDWWTLVAWVEAVDREISMRLILSREDGGASALT